jgi:hypothetical protein
LESLDERVLVVSYADMKQDIASVCRRIAQHCRIEISDEKLVAACEKYFDISYMRREKQKFQPTSVKWRDNYDFIRKGVQGDATLDAKQQQLLRDAIQLAFPQGIPTQIASFCQYHGK